MNSSVIYKENDGYITNGYRLLQDTQRVIQDHIDNLGFVDGENIFLPKKPSEIANEFEIMSTTLDFKNYFIVDHQYRNIDTDMTVVVEITIKMREGIVEE